MALKRSIADDNASVSSFVPQLRQSRRNSISSVASTNQLDKETISQALDQIHSSASQSDSLTTFNEYTSPPTSSSNAETKSIAGDIQGGLSGLYNRLRASVGNSRENGGAPLEDSSERSSLVDAGSVLTPASTSKASNPHQSRSGNSSQKLEDSLAGPRNSLDLAEPVERNGDLQSSSSSQRQGRKSGLHDNDELSVQPNGDFVVDDNNPTTEGSPSTAKNALLIPRVSLAPASDGADEDVQLLMSTGSTSATLGPGHPIEAPATSVTEQSSRGLRPTHALEEGSTKSAPVLDSTMPMPKSSPGVSSAKPQDHQHLDLHVGKSLAPPVVSRSGSPRLDLSRASSTYSNAGSSNTLPRSPLSSHITRTDKGANILDTDQLDPDTDKPVTSDAPRKVSMFSQQKNKVLNKNYWMKDENAKDCFYCGDPFNAFRRKHHCRTCGQIFDAKCTTVISGANFGQPNAIRVCKPCESIIRVDDDSSDFSDDGTASLQGLRPRHGSTGASEPNGSPVKAPPNPTAKRTGSFFGPPNTDLSVPMMSIPATRKAGEKAARKTPVLEIASDRTLARPSSSRSLRLALNSRPHTPNHRRHHSRNQFPKFSKSEQQDHAPFHQASIDKVTSSRMTTFHEDAIIDPDLAPYVSDDQSSGDEQMSIMEALNGDDLSGSLEDKPGIDTWSSRRSRSRFAEKTASSVAFANRDQDSHSGSRPITINRPMKRRNFSFSSANHLRSSPRSIRNGLAGVDSYSSLRETTQDRSADPPLSSSANTSRVVRSSSMRGLEATGTKLNEASLQHVRKLLNQLLTDSGISGVASWEKSLLPILLRATDDVDPDVLNGDDIDIRHYVKLKKIPGGRPGDTSYVSGLVFTKNLALKSMPRSIPHPNILILTFPLEYARHQQHFMSLEPVIRQEREFLQNLVSRIAALRPQLLLVERHVSGLALEYLEQNNIATAYNVKASVLEAVSRCCQTRIISSIDKLAMQPAHTGKCASFYLKTYLNEGRKKTYMFLSGATKELGCTVVLRGADTNTLRKMKGIAEFMIYVVYNLRLETNLMSDENASIPTDIDIGSLCPGLKPVVTVQTMKTHTVQVTPSASSADIEADHRGHAKEKSLDESPSSKGEKVPGLPEDDSLPDDIPMPTFYGDIVEKHRTKILSASPFVKFMQPYLLMRAREQERRLAHLKRLRDQDHTEKQADDEMPRTEKFDLIKPEMVHKRMRNAPKKVREILYAVHDAEYDKALHIYETQSKQWRAYIAGNIDMFDPFAHQNIAVLYTVVCTATTVPCSGPDILALSYYNEHEVDSDFEADCALGQYVEDLCLGAGSVCVSNGCEKKMMEHHRQYVHGEAQLSIFVEDHPCKQQELQDTILMWSVCRGCRHETELTPMSEKTWKYSFGKYLELSFWSSDIKPVGDACVHDLHRDYLRYFGFKNMAVQVRYDSITLLEIVVPRARITWKVDNDLNFKNEVFAKIEDRLTRFIASVKARIKGITAESVLPEKADLCNKEIERMTKKATEDQQNLMSRLREEYMNSKHYEVVALNQVIRSLQEKVVEWDNIFSKFDDDFFPSEKDIRRLAALQLKKLFLDRDESGAAIIDGRATSPEGLAETADDLQAPTLALEADSIPPEKARDLLASVVERETSIDKETPSTDQIGSEAASRSANEAIQNKELDRSLGEEQSSNAEAPEKLDTAIRGQAETQPRHETAETSKNLVDMSPDAVVTSGQATASSDLSNSGLPTTQASTSERAKANNTGIPRPSEGGPLVNPRFAARRSTSHVPTLNSGAPDLSEIDRSDKMTKTATNEPETPQNTGVKKDERKITDRLSLSSFKPSNIAAHSMIPRSIANKKRDTHVSNLAKHFEQLSREFEQKRIRERRQRAATIRSSRMYPLQSAKPIVQVYKNMHEAVEEKEPSDEDLITSEPSLNDHEQPQTDTDGNTVSSKTGEDLLTEETTAESTESEDIPPDDSFGPPDVDAEKTSLDDSSTVATTDLEKEASLAQAPLDLKLELPKHEKSSLMKMLTNFWAERSASGWQPLEYPLNATDHIFVDSDILVREDEPSSLIAFALQSELYQAKLRSIIESGPPPSRQSLLSKADDDMLSAAEQAQIEESLLRPTGTHLKYQFAEGSAKMLCKVFYAEQFDAVRRKCGVSTRIVESLSRCMKWDSKGGKTKSVFLKTLDDRFVLKSLSTIETQAFLKFAPAYFRIMSESLFHELPSAIAKMLGFYQIIIKNPATGVDFNWFLLVMENLFYDRKPDRIFDLKGSMRNRRIQSTGEQNEVLLDENMVEFIYESPLFTRDHGKKLLRASVWNDTLFLSRQNVMDYSLMIAIDENMHQLVVGIIDCIRTYTWDKKLESWIKDRGKNRPTVTSPKEYKSRFREAMGRYVLQAPDCWHQFKQTVETKSVKREDPGEDKEAQVLAV